MNMSEYITIEVTQLRLVEMRVALSVKEARSFYVGEYRWGSLVQTEHSEMSMLLTEGKINS